MSGGRPGSRGWRRELEVVIIVWLVLSLSVGVESFAESEGEVTCVGGRNGRRSAESRESVKEPLWRVEGNM